MRLGDPGSREPSDEFFEFPARKSQTVGTLLTRGLAAGPASAWSRRLSRLMCSAIRFSASITLPALSSQPTTIGKPIQTSLKYRPMGLCPPIYRNRPLHCDSQGKEPTPGIGLVELYDLSPQSNSRLV